jgi:hypothetical protein
MEEWNKKQLFIQSWVKMMRTKDHLAKVFAEFNNKREAVLLEKRREFCTAVIQKWFRKVITWKREQRKERAVQTLKQ